MLFLEHKVMVEKVQIKFMQWCNVQRPCSWKKLVENNFQNDQLYGYLRTTLLFSVTITHFQMI